MFQTSRQALLEQLAATAGNLTASPQPSADGNREKNARPGA